MLKVLKIETEFSLSSVNTITVQIIWVPLEQTVDLYQQGSRGRTMRSGPLSQAVYSDGEGSTHDIW